MEAKQITVNGITATVTIEEKFANRFNGAVTYKRPSYYTVKVAHDKYVDNAGNYTVKAVAEKSALADAEAFLAKVYPAPAAPVAAVAPAAPVADADFDLLAFLDVK